MWRVFKKTVKKKNQKALNDYEKHRNMIAIFLK